MVHGWARVLDWCTGSGVGTRSTDAPVRAAEWLAEHRAPACAPVLVAVHVAAVGVATADLLWASQAAMALLWAPLVIGAVASGAKLATVTFVGVAVATGVVADIAADTSGAATTVDAVVRLVGLVGVATLTSWSVLATVELARRSRTDVSTGLLNRMGFLAAAERERQRALRNGDSLSVVYFDLDGLKETNDHHGHAWGDVAIARFAHHLDRSRRMVDVAGRMGGDEFVLLLPATDATGVQQILRRLYRAIGSDAACLPASAGAVTWARPPSVRNMLRQADRLMYRSKQDGGRSWVMLDLTDGRPPPAPTPAAVPRSPASTARSG